VLALAAFVGQGIFAGTCVCVATIPDGRDGAIFWGRQGRHDIIGKPCGKQMDTPIIRVEQTPEAPGRDGFGAPAVQFFKRFPTWIDRLQDHEPAEEQPVLALPHAGHPPEDRGDKSLVMGSK
jgi:hypothetical protein